MSYLVVFRRFHPFYLFQATEPSGKPAEVLVIDVDIGVYLAGSFPVPLYIFRAVVVHPVKGNVVLQQPVDCIKQVLSATAGPDNDIVASSVQFAQHFTGIRLFPQDIGKAASR